MRTILITGCSSGIGLATARRLRGRGWRVFASCRQAADRDRLAAEGFESPRIDQADPQSVEAGMAEVLAATGGTLSALFANGAFAQPGALADMPRQALRETFEANLFGVHDLIARALPAMAAQGGRIVVNSSVLGIVPARYRGPYVASKHALEGLADVLRMELRDVPWGRDVHVTILQPGPIRTEIRRKSIPRFQRWIDPEASAWAATYRDTVIPWLHAPEAPPRPFERSAEHVAEVVRRTLDARRPPARVRVTWQTHAAEALRRALPTRLRDALLRSS